MCVTAAYKDWYYVVVAKWGKRLFTFFCEFMVYIFWHVSNSRETTYPQQFLEEGQIFSGITEMITKKVQIKKQSQLNLYILSMYIQK